MIMESRLPSASSSTVASRYLIDNIVAHLLTAQLQRAPSDDRIIAEHIDAALNNARVLRNIVDRQQEAA